MDAHIYFDDCLQVLPQFDAKTFDLCISDIPWGSDYDQREKRKDKIHYDDVFDPNRCHAWLDACLRVAKTVIFMVGTKHLMWWIQNSHPVDIFYFVYPFTKTPCSIARVTQVSPLLVWGDRKQWLNSNAIHDIVISHPTHPAAKSTDG